MKLPFYSGISGKIALIFLASFLLIILPVNSFIYSQLKTTLESADSQQLRLEADKLLSQVNLDPLIIPLPPIGYSVYVQTTDGQVFQSLFQSPGFPDVDEELKYVDTFDFDTLKILTVRRPIEFGNGEITLSIARSNQHLQEQLANFRLYLFYVSSAAVGLILIAVFAISGFMLRPIKRIIEASEKIASTSGFEKLPIPKTNDESKQLASSLNAMLTRIETTSQMQQQFFDSATHELKTPLSIMKVELSQSLALTAQSDTMKILTGVLEEVNRLERTISDFLLVSQLKNNALTLRGEKINLAELVYACMGNLKSFASESGINFSIQQSDDTDFMIEADADKMKIVVLNILENAIRYSLKEEVIQVSLKHDSEFVSLMVTNKSKNQIPDISSLGKERYTNSSSVRGMGLGLWICKQILDLHRARLLLDLSDGWFTVEILYSMKSLKGLL